MTSRLPNQTATGTDEQVLRGTGAEDRPLAQHRVGQLGASIGRFQQPMPSQLQPTLFELTLLIPSEGLVVFKMKRAGDPGLGEERDDACEIVAFDSLSRS